MKKEFIRPSMKVIPMEGCKILAGSDSDDPITPPVPGPGIPYDPDEEDEGYGD